MSRSQLRANQILTTFGPGAMVDLPEKSVIIGGLHKWVYEKDKPCIVEEPRLAAKLARLLRRQDDSFKRMTIQLRTPPPSADVMYQKGQVTPGVTGYEFPHWHIVQFVELSPKKHRRRRLVLNTSLEKNGRFKFKDKSQSVVPVRFVRACRKGHVGDIQWREFAHGGTTACQQDLWMEERGTTGDLSDVFIVCECGAERCMREAAQPGTLGKCNSSMPWLDDFDSPCKESNRLLVRTASNAYFAQTLSVISIPDGMNKLEEVAAELWESGLVNVKDRAKLDQLMDLVPAVKDRLEGVDLDGLLTVIQAMQEGKDLKSVAKPVKETEFDALSQAPEEAVSDMPQGDFFVRQLAPGTWQDPLLAGLDKVVLVHRLREVVALAGFTRFEPESTDVTGELDLKVVRAPLVQKPDWMPVSENRGEGFFLQFKPEAIKAWTERPEVQLRMEHLSESYDKWKTAHPSQSQPTMPGLPFIMLHSLAHMLISAISLECGYPLSSLRERIFAPDNTGSMEGNYGILIYTSSAGAEGTLGGLVYAAREIKKHLRKAIQLGSLCSNDPICSAHGSQEMGMERIAGSACHACLYISETSCERFNQFLDRSLVVPTIEDRNCSFFQT